MASWTCHSKIAPPSRRMVEPPSVPGELPGPTVEPDDAVTLPTVPEPPSLEPDARLTLPTVPLMETRPALTSRSTVGAMTVLAILSEPLPCFWSVVLPEPVTVGAVVNTTLLAPRSSLAVEPAATSRLTGVVLPASQRTVALLATANVAPEGKAPDSRPIVEPAPVSMRISLLKRFAPLAPPPMTQTPVPSMARVARAVLLVSSVGAKRLVPVLLAVSLSAGAVPVVARMEEDVNSSVPVPVAAMPAEPPTVKLRAVLALVEPLNSRVAPAERTSLVGSVRAVTPSGLALVPLPKSAMATVPAPMEVAPVNVLAPVSSRRPASVFTRSAVPVRTTSTVPDCGVEVAGSEPPVRVAPAAKVIVLVTTMLFRFSVPAAATLTVPVPSAPTSPILIVPVLIVVPPV